MTTSNDTLYGFAGPNANWPKVLLDGVSAVTPARREAPEIRDEPSGTQVAARRLVHIAESRLAGTLDMVAPHLASPLVSARAWNDLRALAAQIPASLTDYVYLESRLAGGNDAVDLIVRVAKASAQSLLNERVGFTLDSTIGCTAEWARVRALAYAWTCRPGALADGVQQLWLEFDRWAKDTPTSSAARSPGIFADFAEDAYIGWSAEERERLAINTLRLLRGVEVSAGAAACLRRCVEQLPTGAGLSYVGSLAERGDACRVCIIGLRDEEMTTYLRAIGWSGSMSRLANALAPMARAKDTQPAAAILHLDVDDEVRERIGLEYVLARRPQLEGVLQEQPLLDHLMDEGLCARDKCEALRAWPGWSIARLPHELWESLVVRRVNHIKVMYEHGDAVEAKAYLCFAHKFWSRRRHAAARRPSAGGHAMDASLYRIERPLA